MDVNAGSATRNAINAATTQRTILADSSYAFFIYHLSTLARHAVYIVQT